MKKRTIFFMLGQGQRKDTRPGKLARWESDLSLSRRSLLTEEKENLGSRH